MACPVVRPQPVYYHIMSQLNHLVLGIKGEEICPGACVAMVPMKTLCVCDSQLWYFEQCAGNSVYIVSKLDPTGQTVLDVDGDTARVIIDRRRPFIPSQLFTMTMEGVITSAIDSHVVLGIENASLDEGAPLIMCSKELHSCRQKWSFMYYL